MEDLFKLLIKAETEGSQFKIEKTKTQKEQEAKELE